jgi:branched-chain amino acid transport system substrate-binding protein
MGTRKRMLPVGDNPKNIEPNLASLSMGTAVRCNERHAVCQPSREGAHDMNAQKLMSKSAGHLVRMALLIGILVLCLVSCVEKEPIRVCFVAQLTGVQAELGVQERNGVQLAMEEINAAGGVAGRPIELIVRDDLGMPESAQKADRELMDACVVAIIGHATSAQTMAGLAVTNPARVVMLSPTATTPELSGRDDFFFRVSYSLTNRARALAQHIYQGRHMTRIAVISDSDNAAYSKAYLEVFADKYRSLGGMIVAQANFSSKALPDLAPLIAQLRSSNPDGLLIIASDIDTALIAQRTRLMEWPISLFATAWAQTETLLNNGGRAVEGLELTIAIPLSDPSPGYQDFKMRYQARFGKAPSFAAVLGYEAAKVLAVALQETGGRAEGLSQALVGIKNFRGIKDIFAFDQYGDVLRTFYLGAIRDGKYVEIGTLQPTQP